MRIIAHDRTAPHDGVEHEGHYYFTNVVGYIIRVNSQTLAVHPPIDLSAFWDDRLQVGWCRGIHVIDEDRVIVGFSRLRHTAARAAVHFARHSWRRLQGIRARASRPTRIACLNLRRQVVEWETVLEDYDMHAVFSVHDMG